MLPGLRILFAITLLSVSVLIFGLGAAAFLRSAHENFASAPWRPIETPVTARVDLAPATLAMLRVEPETTLPADRIDLPAAITAPHEAKILTEPPIAAPSAGDASPPSAEQIEATAKSAAPEPAPASAPLTITAPHGAPDSPIATTPVEAPARDATSAPAVAEAKIAEINEPQGGAPTIVAALNPEKTEAPAEPPSEPVPDVAAPLPLADAPAVAVARPPTARGNDTLKADDKTIDPAPAAKIAVLGEPALEEIMPLPAKDVRIPNPRIDPAVIEATRLRILAQERARARAAKARRVAAARARARAAAQAKSAPASDPFGTPANATANRLR